MNEELTGLISLRNYLFAAINDSVGFNRTTYNYLNDLKILVDRKIVSLLMEDSFKEYIGHDKIKEVIKEVVQINNIRAGMKVDPAGQQTIVVNESGRPIIKTKSEKK